MRAALALARRGLGNVWPNPAVGCVIVKEGGSSAAAGPSRAAGRMPRPRRWRAPARRRRAPPPMSAWSRAAITARRRPAPTALIAAGIARVVAAVEDPDPRVSGAGIARLREAGVAVETGLCADEAAEINAGFFCRVKHGPAAGDLEARRPRSTAASPPRSGESRWITGPAARERAHLLARDAMTRCWSAPAPRSPTTRS